MMEGEGLEAAIGGGGSGGEGEMMKEDKSIISRGKRFLGKRFPKKGTMGIERIRDLPPDLTPVIAVVNSKSGGRQGKILMQKLRKVLSRAQVIDIRKVDIKEALQLYTHLRNNVTLMVRGMKVL